MGFERSDSAVAVLGMDAFVLLAAVEGRRRAASTRGDRGQRRRLCRLWGPELHRLAKTMSKWRTEILAHHRSGASNGPTEAVNLLIKEGAEGGPWVPQLRQLPTAAPSPLWREVADSSCYENQRACSPFGRVDPH